MRAAALTRRAAIFGVDAAAMRMALGRLGREGLVKQVERGWYVIGTAGEAVNRLARGWATAEARVREWNGRWIVVLADHLGRTDRRQLRAREQALRLTGLARTAAGVWVRPDNLAPDLPALAERLRALGLDAEATVLGGASALPDEAAAYSALWPAPALVRDYRWWIAEMDASEARLTTADEETGARETLLLGQSVIRAINRDPLLPRELVDTALRARMIERMRCYDVLGKGYWARVA